MPRNPFETYDRTEASKILEKHLGFSGRMLSGSKSFYRLKYPTHVVFFNACYFVEGEEKDGRMLELHWGDADVTKSLKDLKAASKELGNRRLYITPEHPYRADFYSTREENLELDERIFIFQNGKLLRGKP